jgi:hypothetical protein
MILFKLLKYIVRHYCNIVAATVTTGCHNPHQPFLSLSFLYCFAALERQSSTSSCSLEGKTKPAMLARPLPCIISFLWYHDRHSRSMIKAFVSSFTLLSRIISQFGPIHLKCSTGGKFQDFHISLLKATAFVQRMTAWWPVSSTILHT